MAIDLYTWLKTFRNQRQLAHQACVFFSLVLLATGFISFVSLGLGKPNFNDFEGEKRRTMLTWMTGALGMVATAVNSILYSRIAQLEKFDPLATEETLSIQRTTTSLVGALALVILAGLEFAMTGATGSEGFAVISSMTGIAGFVTVVAVAYDVLYLLRPSRISLDERTSVPLEYDEFDP